MKNKATVIKKSKNDFGSRTYDKLYDLELHNHYSDGGNGDKWMITRVAGGWIYTYHRLDAGQMNSVFVPYHEEFKPQN